MNTQQEYWDEMERQLNWAVKNCYADGSTSLGNYMSALHNYLKSLRADNAALPEESIDRQKDTDLQAFCKNCGRVIYKANGMWYHSGFGEINCGLNAEPVEREEPPRNVPLMNPIHIPEGWAGVAMDENEVWHAYDKKPNVSIREGWWGHKKCGCYLVLHYTFCDKDWQGDWKDSWFTREEIAEEWGKHNE